MAVFYNPGIVCGRCGCVFPWAFEEDATVADCPNPSCMNEVTIPNEFMMFPDGRCERPSCRQPIDGFLHIWDGKQFVCLKR